MKIIVDAGHGGKDTGAIAYGMFEKDLNLAFAGKLADALEKIGYDVDRSLIIDQYHDLDTLSNLIRISGAHLCISCHNNSSNGKARGMEVIHSIHTDGGLADSILKEQAKLGIPVRSSYSRQSTQYSNSDYYAIIRQTYPDVETIIIEFGFIDNPDDYNILVTDSWQKKIVNSVANGVFNYYPISKPIKTPILGTSIATEYQMKQALITNNPTFDTNIVTNYYSISKLYGVRADLAFSQCILETNWLRFTGIVNKNQNNFAGLGAVSNNKSGESFPTMAAGVEAHIQHLYAYATTADFPIQREIVDTRFKLVSRGSAPNFEDLNGKWAVPGVGYGEAIVGIGKSIIDNYPDKAPSSDSGSTNPSQKHWATDCNNELLSAGILNTDHSNTLDQPASEGMVICIANRLRKEYLDKI